MPIADPHACNSGLSKEYSLHGEYERSVAPRVFMAVIHAAAVAAAGWLLLGGGLEILQAQWGNHWSLATLARRWLLFAAALIYFLRVLATGFYFLERKMGWGEASLISVWTIIIDVLFAILGGVNPHPVGIAAVLGAILYIAGSILNTGSELQRKWWKQRPENQGHLFAGGFFRYARHINYFGDEVLFTGFALITGRVWSFLIPLLMLAGFLFFNVPELDRHLRAHYGSEFEAYASHTRKFVPFLY